MTTEPFQLRSIKQEIKNVKRSSHPIGLTKVTINTTDAMWMVRNVETLLKVVESWKSHKTKEKIEKFKREKGYSIDLKM